MALQLLKGNFCIFPQCYFRRVTALQTQTCIIGILVSLGCAMFTLDGYVIYRLLIPIFTGLVPVKVLLDHSLSQEDIFINNVL